MREELTIRITDRKLPFKHLLTGIIVLIIIILVLAGIWVNYAHSARDLKDNANRLRVMTEMYIDNSFTLNDVGLKLYDTTYNDEMEKAFTVVMQEYNRTGGIPARMDLEGLKSAIGGMDVYVINDRCVIEYATVPADIGLDFAVIYPDFCQYLHEIENTSGFYPDRVVNDWNTGARTKFSYMPTPDHRYILELGLRSEHFEGERRMLGHDAINNIWEFNPYLEEVLLFQKQKRLIGNTTYVPTEQDHAMLDYILWENRTSQEVHDNERERTIFWQVIDLRDPTYGADTSIFAKITYNDALLTSQLNQLAIQHALVAALVLFSGALIAILVSRRISLPIEQLVEDVDTIASGDLDHAVRPVTGYEFSILAERTQVMVEKLKEQIRECEINEKRFMDLIQFLPQGVFETDITGKITFANPAAFSLFGYSSEQLEKSMNILDVLVPEDRVRAKENFTAVLHGKKTEGDEYTAIRNDGSTFPIMVYNTARFVDEGMVLGTRGTIVDISRLKDIEKEMRRLNLELERRVEQRTRELEEATAEMETFTYSVSHDLRAPLRSIDGYSFILQKSTDSRLDEKERDYIEVIRKNIGIMDNLINGLLTLSRVGRQELSREWIDPTALVREIVAMRLEPMPDRQIEISVGELPPCFADSVMLRQVYENLIGNAVKFTRDTNAPRIEIGAIVRDSTILYYVRDNGIGFDMKYADQIFKPFQRLHKPEEFEGSGIGLATVERIIKRHGGRIWAEGEPGKGATFYFTFEESP